MKKIFAVALALSALGAGAQELGNPSVVGPVVVGKQEGSKAIAYLPFSKGSNAAPVIATEDYVKQHSGGGGVPFEQSLRLVDKRPFDSSDPCRKGDLNIDAQSAATYAYLCVGDNWRRIRLDLF